MFSVKRQGKQKFEKLLRNKLDVGFRCFSLLVSTNVILLNLIHLTFDSRDQEKILHSDR